MTLGPKGHWFNSRSVCMEFPSSPSVTFPYTKTFTMRSRVHSTLTTGVNVSVNGGLSRAVAPPSPMAAGIGSTHCEVGHRRPWPWQDEALVLVRAEETQRDLKFKNQPAPVYTKIHHTGTRGGGEKESEPFINIYPQMNPEVRDTTSQRNQNLQNLQNLPLPVTPSACSLSLWCPSFFPRLTSPHPHI